MIPITKQSLEQLKIVASCSSPGPWFFEGYGTYTRIIQAPGVCVCEVPDFNGVETAKFIASASPDVILDLIARVEGMQSALERITANPNEHAAYYMLAEASVAIESFGVK